MKKTPIIIANWKMNIPKLGQKQYVENLFSALGETSYLVIIAPSSVYLDDMNFLLGATNYSLCAQNIHTEEKGSYTGEVSVSMAGEFADYVLVGHSERRVYFGETDKDVSTKIRIALKNNLKPVLCVGETAEEKEAGKTEKRIYEQLKTSLKGLPDKDIKNITVAYEPIWAIHGFRKELSSDIDWSVIRKNGEYIKKTLYKLFPKLGKNIPVLYGGSIDQKNVSDVFGSYVFDGAVVGTASIDPFIFADICKQIKNFF